MSPDDGRSPRGNGRVVVVVITLIGIVTAVLMLASVYRLNSQPGSLAPVAACATLP